MENPSRIREESVTPRASGGAAAAAHAQVQDFLMEVRLCVHKVKQVQEAAVLFVTIPCRSKAKQLGMISETK